MILQSKCKMMSDAPFAYRRPAPDKIYLDKYQKMQKSL